MFRRSIRSRALQFAGSLALCTFAISAQADPFGLQAQCHVNSIVPAQGKCKIQWYLNDLAMNPVTIKAAQVKIDNFVVFQYYNDRTHPVPGILSTLSGEPEVACGTSHVVLAYITKVGVGTVSTRQGSLPSVVCPAAR